MQVQLPLSPEHMQLGEQAKCERFAAAGLHHCFHAVLAQAVGEVCESGQEEFLQGLGVWVR